MTGPRSWRLDFAAIVLIAAALIWPIFKTKYYENWTSIDATFIADARFLSENLPHPGWQPNWYGGTRFDFVYPPALRYGSALIARGTGFVPAKAYHIYTALFYALGIGFVYLLTRLGSGSRGAAWAAAMATATVSPSFLFLSEVRGDAYPYLYQRLNALVRYGEGPHMTALALIPLALACGWKAIEKGSGRWIAAAGAASALVVANNFYGATALAMFFPILVWSHLAIVRDRKVLWRALAIPMISYGLCAVWLTPEYLHITSRNLALVSENGNLPSAVAAAAFIAVYLGLSWRAAGRGARPWTLFVTGAAGLFSLDVIGNAVANFRVVGEPQRLVPELDLCLTWLFLLAGGYLWDRFPAPKLRMAMVAACVLAIVVPSARYLVKPWRFLERTSEYQHRLEYRIPAWIASNRPGTRSHTTGTVRFWWNAWFDEAQIGGGSEQGQTNPRLTPMYWQMILGNNATADRLWMQAFGVDNIVVNDATSGLPFTDHQYPTKYAGVLQELWSDGKGNWIYAVPRRGPGLARVVDGARYRAARFVENGEDISALESYANVLEDAAMPAARTRWLATNQLEVDAATAPGQSIAVQVAYDAGWQAWRNGVRVPLVEDAYGQIRLDPEPGSAPVLLAWITPRQNVIGGWFTLATLLLCGWLGIRRPE